MLSKKLTAFKKNHFNHFSFSICNFRFVIEEKTLDTTIQSQI
jgi:hypothetical protein